MLTNYENFLKAANKAAGFIGAFVQHQLYLNSLHCTENVFYVYSMPISLCKNRYTSSHKVMKGLGQSELLKRMVFRLQIAGKQYGRRHTDKTQLPSGQRTRQSLFR